MLSKLERKDKRRAVKGKTVADAELDWLTLNGLDPLVEAEIMQKSEAQARLSASDPVSGAELERLGTS